MVMSQGCWGGLGFPVLMGISLARIHNPSLLHWMYVQDSIVYGERKRENESKLPKYQIVEK